MNKNGKSGASDPTEAFKKRLKFQRQKLREADLDSISGGQVTVCSNTLTTYEMCGCTHTGTA